MITRAHHVALITAIVLMALVLVAVAATSIAAGVA